MQEEVNKKEQLEILIQKYAQNKKNVSRKDLEGKYRKSYQALKAQITELAESYLKDILLDGIGPICDDPCGYELIDDINALLEDCSYNRMISHFIFTENDLDAAAEYTIQTREKILKGPYQWYLQMERKTGFYEEDEWT